MGWQLSSSHPFNIWLYLNSKSKRNIYRHVADFLFLNINIYRLKGRWVIRCCFPWGAQHIFYVIINSAIEDTSWARNWGQMMMGNAGTRSTMSWHILKCVHTPDLEILMLMNESFKCYVATPDTRSQLGVCLMQIILGKCFLIRVLTSE